jgi:hypothetical protein
MVKEQTVDKRAVQANPNLTPAQEALQSVWEEHTRHEFVTHSTENVLAHVHLYWDQASILVQIGLLDAEKLPIVGVDSARKLMNRNLPSNILINRASHSN